MVTVWSLRSVPVSLLVLMFVFNSGSIPTPHANLHFWFDTIAISGLVGIITYWSRLQRLRWNAGLVMYLYVFLVLLLRNPYDILTGVPEGRLDVIDPHAILHSLWVGVGIFAIGMVLEVLIFHLRQFKIWAWWLALIVSILYVSSIMFFFSGTLSIWSLLDPDTKSAFKRNSRKLGHRSEDI